MAQLKDTVISGNLRVTDTIYGHNPHNVYYVKGTQTSSTGSWTGNLPEVSELYQGLIINYWLPYDGNGNATLNLTLKGGASTGAVNCYYRNTDRLTTHIPSNSICQLTYQTLTINGTSYTGWWLLKAYDGNDRAHILHRSSGDFVANSVVYRYQLLFQMDENTFTPLNNANNDLGTSKTMLTEVEFDPFGEIQYWESTATINANGVFGAQGRWTGPVDLRYIFNCGTSLIANKPLYLKVILQSNGKVKLSGSNPLSQTLPISKDGYLYIHLGQTYTNCRLSLYPFHRIWYHNGTEVVEFTKDTINLEKKQDLIIKSASGPMASFTDAAEYSIPELIVNVDPVQDLHGYDYPWAAGCGKNLLKVGATSKTQNELVFTAIGDGSSFKVNGTPTGGSASYSHENGVLAPDLISGKTYTLSGGHWASTDVAYIQLIYQGDTSGNTISLVSSTGAYTYTATENATFKEAWISFKTGNTFTNDLVQPMLEEGSSATSWAPYSNICSVTGYTSAKLIRTGKNLLSCKKDLVTVENNGITYTPNNETGEITVSGTASADSVYGLFSASDIQNYFSNLIKEGKPVILSGCPSGITSGTSGKNVRLQWFEIYPGTTISSINGNDSASAVPSSLTNTNISICIPKDTVISTPVIFKPMIRFINEDSEFDSKGVSVIISFGSTIYGAILDICKGTLTIDRKCVDMGDYNWVYVSDVSQPFFNYGFSDADPSYITTNSNGLLCSAYQHNQITTGNTNKGFCFSTTYCRVRDTRYSDAASFKTAVSGVKLVYKLATPTTVQLTPNQLTTLLGTNNIWSDTGDTFVKYWTKPSQDLADAIDGMLTSKTSASVSYDNTTETLEFIFS